MKKEEILNIFDKFIEPYYEGKKKLEQELMVLKKYNSPGTESYKQRDAEKELDFIKFTIKNYIDARAKFDSTFKGVD